MSFRTWLESKRSEGTAAFVMDAAESKWSDRGMGNVEITFFRLEKEQLTKAKVETYAERKIREGEENPNPNLLEGESE